MAHVLPVVREEVATEDSPVEFRLLLLFPDRLEVVVYRAVEEVELAPILVIHHDLSGVVEEVIVDVCELPGEIHTCRDHYLVGLVVLGVGLETTQENLGVALYLPEFVVEFILHILFYGLSCPLVHPARCPIKLMHHVCEDTVVALHLALGAFKHWLPYKLQLFLGFPLSFVLIVYSCERYGLKAHP